MKHLDLFSGIGGFALAAKRLGIQTSAGSFPRAGMMRNGVLFPKVVFFDVEVPPAISETGDVVAQNHIFQTQYMEGTSFFMSLESLRIRAESFTAYREQLAVFPKDD